LPGKFVIQIISSLTSFQELVLIFVIKSPTVTGMGLPVCFLPSSE